MLCAGTKGWLGTRALAKRGSAPEGFPSHIPWLAQLVSLYSVRRLQLLLKQEGELSLLPQLTECEDTLEWGVPSQCLLIEHPGLSVEHHSQGLRER